MAATPLAFLFVYLAGLGMAFFVHPRWGLLTYIAVFYIDPPGRWWGGMLPDLRWSMTAATVTLVATLRLPQNTDMPPWLSLTPVKLLIAFTAWTWIQIPWALEAGAQLTLASLFTKYLVLFYLMYRLIDSREAFNQFLLAHVMGCFLLGWLAYIASGEGRLEGVGGPGINTSNAMGMHVATGLMAGAALMLFERRWIVILCMVSMPFMLNAIVQSVSRSAFVALVAGGLTLWYLKPRGSRRLFYGYAAIGLLALGYLAGQQYWDRMNTVADVAGPAEEADGSTQTRLALARAQMDMAAKHPFGTGHRGTGILSPRYLPEAFLSDGFRSSHNTYLTVLVEQGLPGTLIYAGLLAWVVGTLLRLHRTKTARETDAESGRLAAVGAMIAVVAVAGLGVDYIKAEVQIWCLALISILSVWHRNEVVPVDHSERALSVRQSRTGA